MRELTNTPRRNIRREFLTTVSALALSMPLYCSSQTQAAENDADRSTVWIALGAQSEQVNGLANPFNPTFASELITDGFKSSAGPQRALSQSFGEEGSLSFQPEGTDWVFSAAVRYGRANGSAKVHEQTQGCPCKVVIGTQPPAYFSPTAARKFSETRASNNEAHAILDFQAAKDVGLGLLDRAGESTIGFGVRFAQFTSKQILGINADPDFTFPSNLKYPRHHHTYQVTSRVERSFRGLGPSLSWNASTPLLGHANEGEVTLDWGANAAVLFGRQKIRGHHQTLGYYYKTGPSGRSYSHFKRSGNPARTNSVIVPNVGGFAGASFRFNNAKLSLGYQADFFFGAMDGGIDTAKSETRSFYGPFATISIGLGG